MPELGELLRRVSADKAAREGRGGAAAAAAAPGEDIVPEEGFVVKALLSRMPSFPPP